LFFGFFFFGGTWGVGRDFLKNGSVLASDSDSDSDDGGGGGIRAFPLSRLALGLAAGFVVG
jgi:hypothetical protein